MLCNDKDLEIKGKLSVPALETCLPETLVQALAERASGDLRMELARDPAVPVPLEGGVRPPPGREQV